MQDKAKTDNENKEKSEKTKEYLQQAQKLDAHINYLLEQVAYLKSLTTKITTTLKQDVTFGGGNQDKIGDAVSKIIDLQEEINNSIDEYVDKKREIYAVISKVDNPELIDLLCKKYLLHETLEQIACEKNCTYRNICYVHGRALQAVTAILEEMGQ